MMLGEMVSSQQKPVGMLLRRWREQRRVSQLNLALDAGLSARHLSFVESGRAQASRKVLLRLAEKLALPLRERNSLLLAGGFAPVFLDSSATPVNQGDARHAVQLVLRSYDPNPAIAIDRDWNLVDANQALAPLLAGVASELLAPPVSVIRLTIHPRALAPQIVNLPIRCAHLAERLERQLLTRESPNLRNLLGEVRAHIAAGDAALDPDSLAAPPGGILVPLELETALGRLSLFSTTTLFGTPQDVWLDEIAIEAFFPANPETGRLLRKIADERSRGSIQDVDLAESVRDNQLGN